MERERAASPGPVRRHGWEPQHLRAVCLYQNKFVGDAQARFTGFRGPIARELPRSRARSHSDLLPRSGRWNGTWIQRVGERKELTLRSVKHERSGGVNWGQLKLLASIRQVPTRRLPEKRVKHFFS